MKVLVPVDVSHYTALVLNLRPPYRGYYLDRRDRDKVRSTVLSSSLRLVSANLYSLTLGVCYILVLTTIAEVMAVQEPNGVMRKTSKSKLTQKTTMVIVHGSPV